MWVRSLGQEGPLEEGMSTHSSIHAWRIPDGLQSIWSRSQTQLKRLVMLAIFQMPFKHPSGYMKWALE